MDIWDKRNLAGPHSLWIGLDALGEMSPCAINRFIWPLLRDLLVLISMQEFGGLSHGGTFLAKLNTSSQACKAFFEIVLIEQDHEVS